jgi:hypothetical protein
MMNSELERIMFLDFVHRPVFSKTAFRKLDLFPSSGKKNVAPTLLGPLERAGLINGPEDGNRFSFRNVLFSKKTLDDGQSS